MGMLVRSGDPVLPNRRVEGSACQMSSSRRVLFAGSSVKQPDEGGSMDQRKWCLKRREGRARATRVLEAVLGQPHGRLQQVVTSHSCPAARPIPNSLFLVVCISIHMSVFLFAYSLLAFYLSISCSPHCTCASVWRLYEYFSFCLRASAPSRAQGLFRMDVFADSRLLFVLASFVHVHHVSLSNPYHINFITTSHQSHCRRLVGASYDLCDILSFPSISTYSLTPCAG